MEIIGLIAAIIGILSGIWLFADKVREKFRDKQSIDSCYIKELSLEKTPLFVSGSVLKLGRVTAIIGDNGVGKTAVCEWLSVLEARSNVDRWRRPTKHLPIIYSIMYESKINSNIRVHIDQNRVSFFQNDAEVPEPHSLCKFIFVKDIRFDWEEVDDLGALSLLLNYEREIIQEYLSRVGQSLYCTIQRIEPRTTQHGRIDIDVSMQGCMQKVRFRQLSKSEQGRVVLEVAFAMAQYMSKKNRVILIVERSFSSLDKGWMQEYVNWVIREQLDFQIIFNTVSEFGDVDWSGCHIVNIAGKPPRAFFKPRKNT